jgi:hypothetical protein
MFLVYKTDTHHSYASRDIIGIVDDLINAIDICQMKANTEGEEISSDELFNLRNLKQTQGYSGEGEFQFEEVEINTLL